MYILYIRLNVLIVDTPAGGKSKCHTGIPIAVIFASDMWIQSGTNFARLSRTSVLSDAAACVGQLAISDAFMAFIYQMRQKVVDRQALPRDAIRLRIIFEELRNI